MTTPGQAVNTKIPLPTPSDSASQVAADDSHSSHHALHSLTADPSSLAAVLEAPALPLPDPADLASTERTRAALLELSESPRDTLALAALWDENRPSIEYELHRHLHSDSNSQLLQQLLPRLVWHARFFCDEVDDPKGWVARCANLEARRLALQLIENR
jgi:hypothetical protein